MATERTTLDEPKLNPRQELFALYYAQGASLKDAVIKAGYGDGNPSTYGNQLMKEPAIAARVLMHRQAIAGELEITAKTIIGRMSLLADLAMRDKAYGAARQAFKDILDWLTEVKEDKPVQTAAPANDDGEMDKEASLRASQLIDALTRKQ